ncbi:MAG: TlpA disulfide reductase family protein [Bryobacteraceae bacterium]|nr:TlpA disulfide reductase family protein [Bryobacteraceae bacterium]
MTRRDFVWLGAGAAVAAPGKLPTVDEAGYAKLVASNKGSVVLVNFWATWCEPCRAEMPALAKMEAKLKARGFKLVTISADEPEDDAMAQAFLKQAGVTAAAYLKLAKSDDRFINAIDPKWSGALPALFLYDRAGKKVQSYFGESDLKAVEAAAAKLL